MFTPKKSQASNRRRRTTSSKRKTRLAVQTGQRSPVKIQSNVIGGSPPVVPQPVVKLQSPGGSATPTTPPPSPSMPPLERVSTNQQGTNYTPVVLTEQGDEGFRMESPNTMRISLPKTTVDEPMDGHYYNFMNRKRPNNNMGLVLQARQNFMKHVSEISSMH